MVNKNWSKMVCLGERMRTESPQRFYGFHRGMLPLLAVATAVASSLLIGKIAQANPDYQIQGLGIPSGGTASAALGINSAGDAVGYAVVGGYSEGLLFSGGGYSVTLSPGGTNWVNTAINDSDQIVGYGPDSSGYNTAFVVSAGNISDLGSLSGPLGSPVSEGFGIDSAGDAIGNSGTNAGTTSAFLYPAGGAMTNLGTLGGSSSYASGISADGHFVVGYSSTSANQNHAFLYSTVSSAISDLGTLGGSASYGTAVNNSGAVVGYSTPTSGSDFHAFLWTPGGTGGVSGNPQMRDLGDPNNLGAYATAVNNSGTVVGYYAVAGGGALAFVDSGGTMTALNSLLPSNAGWNLEAATGINDLGDIVGYGVNPSGQTEAFELTPVPEPATLPLLGAAVAALSLLRGRRRHVARTQAR